MKTLTASTLAVTLVLVGACGPGGGAPQTEPPMTSGGGAGSAGTTITLPPSTTALPDRMLDGPISGCSDSIELVGQTLALPSLALTFGLDGRPDRVGVTATGASYAFSLRPTNLFDCSSTPGSGQAFPTIMFGFDYAGDFTRTNPMCMEGSRLTLSNFTMTGTPFDSLIAAAAHQMIWVEIDRAVLERIDALLGSGTPPANGDPRCSTWEEI